MKVTLLASFCEASVAQPVIPNGSTWDGDVRLNRPGIAYFGECLGWYNVHNLSTPHSCASVQVKADNIHSVGNAGQFQAELVVLVDSSWTGPLTLNVTTVQDITSEVEKKSSNLQKVNLGHVSSFQSPINMSPSRNNQFSWNLGDNAAERNPHKVRLDFFPEKEEMLCVVDVACTEIDANDVWQAKSQKAGDFAPEASVQLFDAQIEYECGLGRMFDWGNGTMTSSLSRTCQFNGRWDTDMFPCVCKYSIGQSTTSLIIKFL